MIRRIASFPLALLCCFTAAAQAGPPPAKVSVAPIEMGRLLPTNEFKGTVYFKEVSELATEVEGQVIAVDFEEGQHVAKGATLARLDYELLAADLDVSRARVLQDKTRLEQERVRLNRTQALLRDDVGTLQELDDIRFTVKVLEHQLQASEAQVKRLEREVAKKRITAPFDGVVIERTTELGEWKSEGETVAVLARDGLFDVLVNVPEEVTPWVRERALVDMTINARPVHGTVVTIIPRGDVTTRTFPIKVRVEKEDWLLEGMSALARFPIGQQRECLIVSRDALLQQGRENVVVTIKDGAADIVPVKTIGFAGHKAGIEADGLAPGQAVLVKGHERLRQGQPVEVLE